VWLGRNRRPRPAYGHLGRHSKPRQGWPVLYPSWAAAMRLPRRGPHVLRPGAPLPLPPGWAGAFPSQAGPSRHRSPPAPRSCFCPGWAFSSCPGVHPHPGWAGLDAPGWAASPPAGPGSPQPRLGCFTPGWAGKPAGRNSTWPAPIRPALHGPGRDSLIPAGMALMLYPGQDGPGQPIPRPDYCPPRPKFTSSDIFPRSASPLASCASPRTPLGSDWHILHRRMLVLGRPLAQTSISLLS
jgi:hypothetical protein